MRRIVIACLAFAILGLSPAWAQKGGPLSPAQFRDRIAQEVLGLADGVCVRPVDDFTLHAGASEDACEGFINTENAYRDYLNTPENLDVIVQRYLSVAAQVVGAAPLDNEGDERERMVVVLRHRDYLQNSDVPADTMVVRPFLGDLIAVLMLDSPTHLTSIAPNRLAELRINEDQAFDLARRNLRMRIGPIDSAEERGVDIVSAQSALISGTLWLGDGCTPRDEERLALLAARDTYYATDGRDAQKREFFLGFAQHIIAQGESMSDTMLVCRSGRWIVYGPRL